MTMLKRVMALLLAMVLIFALVPMGAMAAEVPETDELRTEETEAVEPVAEEQILPGLEVVEPDANVEVIPTQVNPLYADIYTAEAFDLPEFSGDTETDAEPMATGSFVSKNEAAVQLRKQMIKRADTITVYVKGPISDRKQTAQDLMDLAMVHTGNPKEGDYLMWHWSAWSARITSRWNGSNYDYIYEYVVDYNSTAAQEAELDTAIMYLLWDLNVSYKSDYEKIKAVYDYICANVTYDYENLEDDSYKLKHTAYAALIDKTAVCQGYALLFYRLMLELGVDNRLISGIGGGGAHGWNIVELDGLYYNVDSTWDAGVTDYNYFLMNTWNFLDHSRYMEYETIAFHQAYPMAAENYVRGVKGEEDPYIWLGVCSDNIMWVLYRNGTLEIAGTGAIPDYPAVASAEYMVPWYYWRDDITGVTVCEGITRIGAQNFSRFPKLTNVTLPESLVEIGEHAFFQSESLTEVDLPSNLRVIDNGAFRETSLSAIDLPDSLTTIGFGAFTETDLRKVEIPGGVSEADGFYLCSELAEVVLSEGIKSIAGSAFSGCTALTEITIPGSVTQIGDRAFEDCKSLSVIRFCGDAPKFWSLVFYGVTATAYYPADNETWTDDVKQDYRGTITWIPFDSRVDLNADLQVDDADVEYLLWHTLFPDTYPVGEDVDLTKDSLINDADVEYLLWHTLFPDMYPV